MESKISLYPTSQNDWPAGRRSGRFAGVRSLLVAFAVLALAPVARAQQSSNPPFLGIMMAGGGPHGLDGCIVEGVTRGSPAEDGGLLMGDIITDMGGARTPNCDALVALIHHHVAGESVEFDVQRAVERAVLHIALSTRAEVLARRYLGHVMDAARVVDVDDSRHAFDLSEGGRVTVVGFFKADNCSGCARVFERIADGLEQRGRDLDSAPLLLGVTPRAPEESAETLRKEFTSGVALAATDEDTLDRLAFEDADRFIYFMVIDARGVVRFVTPVAPDADDLDAAIDEVLAAAEQAEHAPVAP